ncbi:META domain-containing protein [Deminuibacter soli]|uniref:META domain-containing protein n=1 Tax=Deminuibacter soli TaxID=2291815 RepID=A0A3E1NIR9_9BACT|nr:META domain-containing protein [Deminuibacter soli]RFM27829.1 META domain-containing protein [Deminuibacter soli]
MKPYFLYLLAGLAITLSCSCKTQQSTAAAGDGITGKQWRLTELYGQPVTVTGNSKIPGILLNATDKRITGNGGCNTFNGSYDIKDHSRISFSQMASTQMACIDMTTETKLLQALQTADNYTISGNQLSLNKARMAPLARFEAVAP